MTKKAFKHDMQRGLGSCVVALKNTQDAEKEKYLPLVLWGCSRDMAYDAQCEGCRSVYLYELITEFPDKTPFVDVIEKRLFQCIHSTGWEFFQDCEILSYFVSDGDRRSWKILTSCYDTVFQILLHKRKRTKNGRLPERDNFEALCISMVSLCFDDHRKRKKLYQMFVKNIGFLAEHNTLCNVSEFDWFQSVAENALGKKVVHKLLHREDADEYTKTYARLIEEYRNTWDAEWEKRRKAEPQTADELYMRLMNGERSGKDWSLHLLRGWMRQNKEQEVLRLASYYRDEGELDIRYHLLRMLANEVCAETLDLTNLI
ncbi:MAG: hypothetical protein K2M91_15660, partial [Lachnospiraceae bacterium]|nr:hypothetical protein [Lachnospiraceae bacterium]